MHAEVDRSGANPRIVGLHRCAQVFPTEEVPDDAGMYFEMINGTWQAGPYLQALAADEASRATKQLNIKGAITKLRQAETDAATAVAGWGSLANGQKDAVLKNTVDRAGKLAGFLADLIQSLRLDK